MSKNKQSLRKLYEKNIVETRKKIKDSVKDDNLIIHSINNVDELVKSTNMLSKRLREWYALYNPETVEDINDNDAFLKVILTTSKDELLKKMNISSKSSMGADLKEMDIEEIMLLAKHIRLSNELIEKHKVYIEQLLKKNCPNMTEIVGSLIGAQFIEHAGSIKNLATMTASTIQLLGAEKALFRHIKTGARSPKHGLILQHPFVANAKNKGKAARQLADKVSIAIKVDFFKGEYIANKLIKELKILENSS